MMPCPSSNTEREKSQNPSIHHASIAAATNPRRATDDPASLLPAPVNADCEGAAGAGAGAMEGATGTFPPVGAV